MLILERILEEIRTLDASKSVTEAIQSGVETLKSLLPFKVEVLGTMDSLKDVLKEVENLSQIVQSDDDYAGLEEEFMAIVSELETGKQEKPDKLEEEELKRCLDELLSVPATPPPEEETSFEKSVLDQ
ncbi:uncharacterized protein LOC135142966 [Zophobas morio]|uniref:uncharacterized protein LOC135142966 n=1 Tax=Zophobas morio TaxID=2755281 RepID=UPI003082BF58